MDTRHTHANDDKEPFTSIGLQTLLILNRLRLQALLMQIDEDQNKPSESETDASDNCEQNAEGNGE